jgi:hypothetical protein
MIVTASSASASLEPKSVSICGRGGISDSHCGLVLAN